MSTHDVLSIMAMLFPSSDPSHPLEGVFRGAACQAMPVLSIGHFDKEKRGESQQQRLRFTGMDYA